LCDFGHAIVYRSGRADVMPMLVVALLARAWLTVADDRSRRRQLLLLSMLLVPTGLHSIPYVVILIACDAALRRRLPTVDILACAGGCALGGVGTLALFAAQGEAFTFISQTAASGYNIVGAILQAVVIGDEASIARLLTMLHGLLPAGVAHSIRMNPSLVPLLLALGVATVASRIASRPDLRTAGIAGLTTAGCVILGMMLAGRFPSYYAWMASIPAAVAAVTVLQKLVDERMRLSAAAVALAIALALGLGLPSALLAEVRLGGREISDLARSITDAEIRSTDIVYGDPVFYYDVKGRGRDFYSTTYSGGRGYPAMSRVERDRVTLVIVWAGSEAAAMAKLGGEWELKRSYATTVAAPASVLLVFRRNGAE
jgi:hypothetical protein